MDDDKIYLRDRMAMAALTGVVIAQSNLTIEAQAQLAYDLADEMLKERLSHRKLKATIQRLKEMVKEDEQKRARKA